MEEKSKEIGDDNPKTFPCKSQILLQITMFFTTCTDSSEGLAKIGKPLREFSELKRKIFTLCKNVKKALKIGKIN